MKRLIALVLCLITINCFAAPIFNDAFMKEVSQSLQGGEAALFLLIRKMTAERVMEGLQGMGGKIMRTSFDETKEATLREALAGASGG